jgi:hypothetical protein
MGEIGADPLSRWVLERKQAGVRQRAHSLLARGSIHLDMLRIRILYVRFIPTLAGAASLSSTCEQKLCPLRGIFERGTGRNLVVQPLTVQALTASGRIETLIVYDLDRRRQGAELKPRKQAFEAALEEID